MAEEIQPKSQGTKRWVQVLLVVSLAFNLLIVGIVGGAMMNWSKWRSHHPPRLDMAGGPLTRALTREDRRAIGRQMRKAYREGDAPAVNMRAELDALVSELKADPFDPSAVKDRLERHRGVFHDRFALGQTLLLERLSEMQPGERAAYADRLRDVLRHHGEHGHGKYDHE